MSDHDVRRGKWKHRPGDRYVVICTHVVGNAADYEFVHYVSPKLCTTVDEAQSYGFTFGRSDDFNIGVVRRGELVAVLWMDELVDDEPSEIADRAKAVRLALGGCLQ